MGRLSAKRLKAFILDGSTGQVTIPITPSTTGFSVSMWVNSGGVTNNARLLDWQDGGPAKGFTLIQQTGGNINVQTHNTSVQTANISAGHYANGKWNHLVVTHNGTTVTTYQNGTQIAQDTSAAYTAAAATMTLGRRAGGANPFKGRVGQFVFFDNKVLSASERTELFQRTSIPTGATVLYEFDGNVTDGSGNGNNGTATAAVYETWVDQRVYTSFLSANSLNFAKGTTNKVTITDTAILQPETNNTFTWTCWAYLFDTRENVLPRLIAKGGHYTCFMGDQTNAQRNRVALETVNQSNDAATEFWGSTRLTANRWYFIATTFNDGTVQHYINAIPDTMTTLAGPYVSPLKSTSGADLIIGNSSGNNRNTPGLIRNVRDYNVVLTQAEITQLFNGIDVTRGLVGKWVISEGTGASVADSSGNGNNGTITGATWQAATETRTATGTRSAAGNRSAA